MISRVPRDPSSRYDAVRKLTHDDAALKSDNLTATIGTSRTKRAPAINGGLGARGGDLIGCRRPA